MQSSTYVGIRERGDGRIKEVNGTQRIFELCPFVARSKVKEDIVTENEISAKFQRKKYQQKMRGQQRREGRSKKEVDLLFQLVCFSPRLYRNPTLRWGLDSSRKARKCTPTSAKYRIHSKYSAYVRQMKSLLREERRDKPHSSQQ
jgi:hypothetical protein